MLAIEPALPMDAIEPAEPIEAIEVVDDFTPLTVRSIPQA